MNNKKGQTTIFIILGVIILIIFLALILLRSSSEKSDIESNLKGVQEVSADLKPIQNYATECFETITKEGLFLLGSQGGFIYQSQGGSKPDYKESRLGEFFVSYDGKKVPYRINYPVAGTTCDPNIPGYPTKNIYPYPYGSDFDFTNPAYLADKRYEHKDCFGKKVDFEVGRALEDLAEYVRVHAGDCDFSSFNNYEFAFGQADVQAESTKAQTVVDITYPMTLTNKNNGAKSELNDFKVSLKLSLEGLFDFANSIMEAEVSDPRFDISLQSTPEFNVLINKNTYDNDDLVIIKSNSLILDGRQFGLIFARINRYPVLEYVYNTTFHSNALARDGVIGWKDLVKQGLSAVDPDEDDLEVEMTTGAGYNKPTLVKFKIPYGKNPVLESEQPYTITLGDVNNGKLKFNISASDGEFSDYQTSN